MALQNFAPNLAAALPGWQMILFIGLILVFLTTGAIVTFIIMSRLRWPFKYVVVEDVSGAGFGISRKGRARIVGFGDGGEELFLLKGVNKYRVGYGKRIGRRQVSWVVGEDGFWYQWSFGDFNKKLREMGMKPSSVNVRLSMAAVRKGLDSRYENKTWLEKYGPMLYAGLFIFTLLIFAGIMWYVNKKNVEVAQINAEALKESAKTQEATQKTLATIDQILSKFNLQSSQATLGGSGLIPAGDGG